MSQSQFSLSWDSHQNNICTGLSSLQQNGEFVDMTLAADGHFVKVHQLIMALASPYIKDLITSAECQHPVIFLNKISYNTLCSILEYIYTGEVLVPVDKLSELIQAGKELHIRGLKDMNLNQGQIEKSAAIDKQNKDESNINNDTCYQITQLENIEVELEDDIDNEELNNVMVEDIQTLESTDSRYDETNNDNSKEESIVDDNTYIPVAIMNSENVPGTELSVMRYTVSNQGSLQMILNRFIYYLKHTNRDKTRQWRCVDYVSGRKCPAHVITKHDVVLHRIYKHTHPFHDSRILKKARCHAIFSAIHEAESEGKRAKKKAEEEVTTPPTSTENKE